MMISYARIAADLGDRRPVGRRIATFRERPGSSIGRSTHFAGGQVQARHARTTLTTAAGAGLAAPELPCQAALRVGVQFGFDRMTGSMRHLV
jgi:hypothetical protein